MNFNQIKISIIIPAYNTQKHISSCLESILCQHINYEIIIIDDGSTDNTNETIKKMQSKYNNIILIEQDNLGPSIARNNGIKLAQGEYLIFLDSDDTLVPHSLNRLYKKAHKTGADIIIGQMNYIYSKKKINLDTKTPSIIKNTLMSGEKYFEESLKNSTYTATATNFFYRNSWIRDNNFFFKENILYEDELWTMEVLTKCLKVYHSSINFYNYHKREGSIINSSITTYKIRSLQTICNELIKNSNLQEEKKHSTSSKWTIINLARICKIALHRIKNEDDRKFFKAILKTIKTQKKSMDKVLLSCLNRYI